jgi:alpha-L-fucosidase 2
MSAIRTILKLLSLVLFLGAGTTLMAAPASASMSIWEDAPVDSILMSQSGEGIRLQRANAKIQWDAWSLPVGNGRLGAVFYGNVQDELVQFNENSLWTGGDASVLKKRQNDRLGRSDNVNYGSYQPFGDIHISLPHSQFTNYRRDLDLSRAVGTVTYKSGGVNYRREYFASYPDQVIVVRLSADKPGSISGSVRLTDRHFGKITTTGNTITARGTLDEKIFVIKGFSEIAYGTPEQIANAARAFAGNNMKYEAQMRVMADGGALLAGEDGELKVANANKATFFDVKRGESVVLDKDLRIVK